MNKAKLAGLLCVLVITHTQSINASDFGKRFYLSPMASYISTDDDRNADNAVGIHLGIGKPITPKWNIELAGLWNEIKQTSPNNQFKRFGAVLDSMYFLKRSQAFSPYGILGLGVFNTEYAGNHETRPMANAGFGFMSQLLDYGVKLRGDLRLQYDESNAVPNVKNLQDWVVNLGLSVPLGKRSSTQPHFPRLAALDDDQDSVPNSADNCANTPTGANVNSSGCQLDSDGDSIIDLADVCPGTPPGTPVDQNGCVSDKDNDGIADLADQCADTPANTKVKPDGCMLDNDVDGIADNRDQCAQTPANVKIDEFGCEIDNDHDGIADSRDACNNTPTGFKVADNGCMIDGDLDGIADNRDQCANTLANIQVDTFGCEVDSDNDTIVDSLDSCPNTKLGAVIDEAGCGVRAIIAAQKSIRFDLNSNRLTVDSKRALDVMAVQVKIDPSIVIGVAGYTDNTGSSELNSQLSTKRANIVKDYLNAQGVPDANLVSKGYGSSSPIADNTTQDGRILNRRVEFFVME